MGDTGSLAIGAGLAAPGADAPTPCCCCRSSAALFVVETVSVILQVGSFRSSGAGSSAWRRSTTTSSSRGWPETTVIIRFWIIAGLCTAVGLGLYYADFSRDAR